MQIPGLSSGLLIQKELGLESGSQQFHPLPGGLAAGASALGGA